MGLISNLKVKFNADTKNLEKGTKKAKETISGFGKSLKKIGGLMAGAFAVQKIISFVSSSVKAYDVQIQAEKKLERQLISNGKTSRATLTDYKNFASQLQNITTVGDETTIGLLQLAESMNSIDAKKATKGAIGLSKAFGIDLKSALKMVVLAEKGDYNMLQRYVPALRSATDDAQKAAIVQKTLADGFKLATTEAKTGLGPIKQLGNKFGDLKEALGSKFWGGNSPIIKWLDKIVSHGIIALKTVSQIKQEVKDEHDTQNVVDGLNEIEDVKNRLILKGMDERKAESTAIRIHQESLLKTKETWAKKYYSDDYTLKERESAKERMDILQAEYDGIKSHYEQIENAQKIADAKRLNEQKKAAAKKLAEQKKEHAKLIAEQKKFDKKIKPLQMQGSSISKVEDINLEGVTEQFTTFDDVIVDTFDDLDKVGYALSGIFQDLGTVIADSLLSADASMGDFVKSMGQFLLGLVKKFVAAAVAALALAVAISLIPGMGAGFGMKAAETMSFGQKFVKGFGGFAGLAEGGVVPEGYPNDTYPALLSSKEVVTPPGKLPSGSQDITVHGILRGKDIYLSSEKYINNQKRLT